MYIADYNCDGADMENKLELCVQREKVVCNTTNAIH